VAFAEGDAATAERDAYDALACAAGIQTQLGVPDILDLLGCLAAGASNYREAPRLMGAAEAIRGRTGEVRYKIYEAECDAAVAVLRGGLGQSAFDEAWAEGTGLSTEEAIAYAQRGRGERKRPSAGWASLTPTEHNVVRLVTAGLANKDIAGRLFISPRTVETHLTHIYAKLGLSSRVKLAQLAAEHI
jgi:DNA-binding CsgD family transcriptional regulator